MKILPFLERGHTSNKWKKGQESQMLFWIIFAVVLAAIGLYFAYMYFRPGTDSILKTLFRR